MTHAPCVSPYALSHLRRNAARCRFHSLGSRSNSPGYVSVTSRYEPSHTTLDIRSISRRRDRRDHAFTRPRRHDGRCSCGAEPPEPNRTDRGRTFIEYHVGTYWSERGPGSLGRI